MVWLAAFETSRFTYVCPPANRIGSRFPGTRCGNYRTSRCRVCVTTAGHRRVSCAGNSGEVRSGGDIGISPQSRPPEIRRLVDPNLEVERKVLVFFQDFASLLLRYFAGERAFLLIAVQGPALVAPRFHLSFRFRLSLDRQHNLRGFVQPRMAAMNGF